MNRNEPKLTVTLGYDQQSMRYKKVFLEHPLSVCLRITEKCTRSCRHCSPPPGKEQGKTSELKKLMAIIRNAGTPRLNISGGEPFTHPDIIELLDYAKSLGFSVSVTTNGDKVEHSHISFMKKNLIVPDFSLDGHNDEINKGLRGEGHYSKVRTLIAICRDEDVPFILNCTIQQANLKYVDEFVRFGTDLHAKKITFIVIRPQGLAEECPEILLSDEDLWKLRKEVASHPKDQNIGLFDLTRYPKSFVLVDYNGRVFAQSHEESDLVGDTLRDVTEFKTAWLKEGAFDHRGHFLHYIG